MKLVDHHTRKFNGQLLSRYKFDKLSDPEAVVNIIKAFVSFGVNIETVTAMEFGDYDDPKKIITYTDMKKIDQMVEDFKDIGVETYTMRGTHRHAKLIATVYPDINVFSIRYDPEIQQVIEACVQKVCE